MALYKVIVEKHPDVYVAYPLGLKGVVVGEGSTYEEALDDVKSAIRFHIETFGTDIVEADPALEVFVAEAGVATRRSSHYALASSVSGKPASKGMRIAASIAMASRNTYSGPR